MNSYRVAFIPGDGVGPEVSHEAQLTLEACANEFLFDVSCDTFGWNCDYYLAHGRMMPENALDVLKPYDAVFLGSMGNPTKVPDHISLGPLLSIRQGFCQYVNLRPIRMLEGVTSPLSTATPKNVDFVVVRENTEGEYCRLGGMFCPEAPNGFATQMAVFSRKGCERVMRFAFELARKRKAEGHMGKVTSCTKSNALNYSMVFWDKIFSEVAAQYPDIDHDYLLVDALSMFMVSKPERFDVIVASNLFGDIITDLGSVLQGGMGFAAGANLNPEKDYPSMFEPIHGSALDIAGKNIVNPIASLESIRMMLEHFSEVHAAKALLAAEQKVLSKGMVRTRDMGGTNSMQEMGAAVRAELTA